MFRAIVEFALIALGCFIVGLSCALLTAGASYGSQVLFAELK
jgi:hypothetical protein